MFTPQELQEKTFVKAVFGGYDMNSVDEFLEPLINDYIALYKENAVLKSKMKILVEKLEEYRSQEDTMKKTLVAATEASEKLKADTERRCAQMISQAENNARLKTSDLAAQVAAEEERVEQAKNAAQSFIEIIEREVSRQLDQLETLKTLNLAARQIRSKPYDFESEYTAPPVEPSVQEDPRTIADEIGQNLEKVIGPSEDTIDRAAAPAAPTPPPQPTTQATIKFTDLQFGKNYDPNRS